MIVGTSGLPVSKTLGGPTVTDWISGPAYWRYTSVWSTAAFTGDGGAAQVTRTWTFLYFS